MDFRIYIANLGAYNRGCLVGRWLDLPCDDEDIQKCIKTVLSGDEAIRSRDFADEEDEEIAIHDYELPWNIGEYENIKYINEAVEAVEDNLSGYDWRTIGTIISLIADECSGNQTWWELLNDNDTYIRVIPDVQDERDLCLKSEVEDLPFLVQEIIARNHNEWTDYLDESYIGRQMINEYGWSIHDGQAYNIYTSS